MAECRYCKEGDPPHALEWHEVQGEEDLALHIEVEHHRPVKRDNETLEEAVDRWLRENPSVERCVTCTLENMPWTWEV